MSQFCQMIKNCKSFTPDNSGECLLFSNGECKFVSDKQYVSACSICVHNELRHVDKRCKTCLLKDAIALSSVEEKVLEPVGR